VVALEDIIERCKKYDVTAQRLLYDCYANQMRCICMRYIGNQHEVKDIVHDGFIKIFSNIKQYKKKGSFEGWMVRIFINTALKHIKKTKKNIIDIDNLENNLADTDSPNFDMDIINEEISNDYNSIEQLNFTQQEILDVIQSIPEQYRIIFNLFHIEEFKHEEIAEMLNIDKTTSRIRLLRARNLIREELVKKAKELQKIKFTKS
jgi:RNA polymerase sigma-70 factor, ECF subfamily